MLAVPSHGQFAMSTTEAEYLARITALCNMIPLSRIVKEIKLPMDTIPKVISTVFEDDSGAVELAKVPKTRPQTKFINPKYHHFRKYVSEDIIQIVQVNTTEQLANIFTKNLPHNLFLYFHQKISGW
jgi:hypothetical protein